jgi:hypothetical protein
VNGPAQTTGETPLHVQTCPTDVVHATPARVWELISSPASICSWAEGTLVDGPARPLQAGDRVVMRSGPCRRFRVEVHVLGLRAQKEIALDVMLPFGVVNHEVIVLRAIDDGACRVTLN